MATTEPARAPLRAARLRSVAAGSESPDPVAPARRGQRPVKAGPDRLTVVLVTLAMFLGLVAVLADQLRGPASVHHTPVVLLRRIYETRIVQTVPGAGSGTAVSQSVSSSAAPGPVSAPPTTGTSG